MGKDQQQDATTMNEVAQEIEIPIYPYLSAYNEPCSTTAYVHGNWAAHQSIHEDVRGMIGAEWSITHLPSGAIAFVGGDLDMMIEAAKRLNSFEQPSVIVEGDGERMPHIKPLSMAWIRKMVKLLGDLDIMAVSGPDIVTMPQLVRHLNKVRKEAKVNP